MMASSSSSATMATPDVVRSGAIFRVRNAATMKSPLPRLPGSAVKAPRSRLAIATPERRGLVAGASALERIVHTGSSAVRVKTHATHAALKRPRGSAVAVGLSLMMTRETESADDRGTVSARKKRKKKRRKKIKMATPVRSQQESEEDEGDDHQQQQLQQPTTPLELMRSFNRRVAKSPMPRHVMVVGAAKASAATVLPTPPLRNATERHWEPEAERTPVHSAESDDEVEESEEEYAQVQKRLVYTDTPPAKPKAARAKQTTKKRARRTASPRKVRAAVATLETSAADAVVASTPARTRQRTAIQVLCEWFPMWPPIFEADEMQLVICGQVLGQPAAFTVERRVTVSQFVSTDHQNVRLDGCLDIEKAQDAGVPPRVMEVLVEGIPTQWRRRLEPYAPPPEPMSAIKWKPMKRAVVAQSPAQATDPISVEEPLSAETGAKPPRTPARAKATKKKSKVMTGQLEQAAGSDAQATGVKRSRSGRILTPVMEWWRNERMLTTVEGETRIDHGSPACIPSSRDNPQQQRKSPELSASAAIARQKIQSIREAQQRSAEWSTEQLQALEDAKAAVCPTGPTFWEEVARRVPGKTAEECRARTFADLTGPATRRTAGGSKRSQPKAEDGTVKIHRAGSNAFKKQVREFVHHYEQRHIDDVFGDSTPSKVPIVGAIDFDDLKSPDAPRRPEPASDDDDDGDGIDDVDELPSAGRELLQRVTLSKRDEVDSYVLALKRTHAGLGNRMGRGAVRQRASELETPVKKNAVTRQRHSVHMTEEVGAHLLEGTVSPGGTTKVRVEKDSDDDDEDEDEFDSDDEMEEQEMDFA